jgi:hypothetical protein
LRASLLRIWRARGGGFYGLGYLVTFIVMEVRLVGGEVMASESVVDFVASQAGERVLRLGIDSFVNSILAFAWPAFVLDRFQLWGLVALAVGYLAFEKVLKPRLEATFPELRFEPEDAPTRGVDGNGL